MAAFNYTQPPDATGEELTYNGANAKFDIFPNFNGQAGIPSSGNFTITGINDIPQGLLWTAHYGIAGSNTITIQFSSPLLSVSTTTSHYTLTGPSAPSISSVVWNAGSRNIVLNLSGALSAVNTYTLAIATNKVQSGSQVSYIAPKVGTFNWPNLVVDVILPSQIDTIGVGIQQDVVLGDPQMNTSGDAVAIGIDQTIDLGTPDTSTLVAETGVGIQQDVDLGIPTAAPNIVATSVGINQIVGLGSPAIAQEQQPVGVGFSQTIDLGTPVADINPLTPIGVGITVVTATGSPTITGSGNVIGLGITQLVGVGTPVAVRVLDQAVTGVGVDQLIDLGTPDAQMNPISTFGVGIDQIVDLGNPAATAIPQCAGVGINQPVDFGTPIADINPLTPIGVGLEETVNVGTPIMGNTNPIDTIGEGIEQLIDLGEPIAYIANPTGVGFEQPIDLGTPISNSVANAIGVGISQLVDIGLPHFSLVNMVSVGIQQDVSLGIPRATNPLHFTDEQAAAMADIDDALHRAFGYGVAGAINTNLITLIPDYIDQFTTLQQEQTKTIFKDTAAAAMTTLNIPGVLPTTNENDAVSLAKVTPGGSPGTMIFIDGVLVNKVSPT